MSIQLNGTYIETDSEGYLLDPEMWDERVAGVIAEREGVVLGEEHRRVLDFIRDHYENEHVAIDARFVIRYIAEDLGYGAGARQRLYELFPYGYMQQACKVAGMRRPRAWSTG